MAYGEIPRGLADLQVAPLIGGTATTWADIPGPRSLTWNVDADTDELEGGNQVIAKVRNPGSLSGSIELGHISLAGLAVILNSDVETDGDSPNAVTTLDQGGGVDIAYFQIAGQAPDTSVAGAAYRVTIMQALHSGGPSETMEVNSWNTPTLDFEGVELNGVLVRRQQYESEMPLPPQ